MKIHEVARDVGAREAYVVSASGFSEDTVKVAGILGVKLLDLDEMAREVERLEASRALKEYFMAPAYGVKKAREYAEGYALKKFFKTIEKPSEVTLEYHPFYVMEGEYVYYEEKGLIFTRTVEVRKRIGIIASALKPGVLYCNIEEASCELVEIQPLSDDEIELLSVLSTGEYTYSELLEETGWHRQKLSRVIKSLVGKGLVEVDEDADGRKIYSSTVPSLDELDSTYTEILEDAELEEEASKGGLKLDVEIPYTQVKKLVEKMYGVSIHDVKLVYLPVYRVKMVSTEDERKYRYVYLLPLWKENVEYSP